MILFKNIIKKFFYDLLINIINFYQKIISPITPARCRYYPTCSNYAKQALQWHGVSAGSWLSLKRIGRCHPLGGHGIDFVPLPLASYTYYYVNVELSLIKYPSIKYDTIYRDNYSYVALLNHLMKS
ncbi:membrane protein insertion efficiency factor YidD [Psychrobacter urativorans]|uniref:Putative membrane protein insertion efficiency factor n=1 Tax=Psychrobacter urativorans TaxID=45610 RepID=A0A0M4U6T7_9GAMM|nr:membrane protein insertion efficiency factor YidD [Psychrobacter urativorans]ALF59714.1 membrane protein insertion efficiency factor YidD [Psychrobacter urativorans]